MGRGWIAAVWCVRLAMVEFASSVVLTPAGVMKLVNIADLKSAASRLVGSSPIPGTRKYSTRFQKIPWTLDAAMLRGFLFRHISQGRTCGIQLVASITKADRCRCRCNVSGRRFNACACYLIYAQWQPRSSVRHGRRKRVPPS